MDFENPKVWEALQHEAEKAIDSAQDEMLHLDPASAEFQLLQKNITQYEVAITIAKLALRIAGSETQPAPVETPRTVERKFLVDDRVRVKIGKYAGECGSVHDTNLIGTRFTVYLDSDDIHVFSADALELEPAAVDYEEQPIYRND